MVLRKERNTSQEGNSNTTPTPSASSSLTSNVLSPSSSLLASVPLTSRTIMSNEQPVSKRQRIDNRNVVNTTESTSITTVSNNGMTTLPSGSSTSSSSSSSSLSSSLKDDQDTPPDILVVHPSTSSSQITSSTSSSSSTLTHQLSTIGNNNCSNSNSTDEVDRAVKTQEIPDLLRLSNGNNSNSINSSNININNNNSSSSNNEMKEFEEYLTKQCLCNVNERILRKPFQNNYYYIDQMNGIKRIAQLYEWPINKLLQFLSNLQLLFDIYLKQNTKGLICSRIMDICDALITQNFDNYNHHNQHQHQQHSLIDEIIELSNINNKYVQYLSCKVISSFLVIAKNHNFNDDWIKKIVDNLFLFDNLDTYAVQKIHFSLDIIKRIVEWKDIDIHPLDDDDDNDDNRHHNNDNENGSNSNNSNNIFRNNSSINDNDRNNSVRMISATGLIANLRPQQPSLENNYFAVYFNNELASTSNNSGGNGDRLIATTSTSTSTMNNCNNSGNSSGSSSNSSGSTSRSHSKLKRQINDTNNPSTSGTLSIAGSSNSCHLITLTDSESFDTTNLKCITIKILENKWPALVKNMSNLIISYRDIKNSENCILTFLSLWENIISVKANLSIIETLPFYSQLDKFELLLNNNLSCTIYKQMLNLFNEALCYGSTLALQDLLPEETCQLAHQIVRHVKDYRILDSLPRRQPENIIGLIGFRGESICYKNDSFEYMNNDRNHRNHHRNGNDEDDSNEEDDDDDDNDDDDNDDDDDDDDDNHSHHSNSSSNLITNSDMDKTILQKMVLLVLKSVAVTVKEIRSDSSDSSIDSTDYDAFQDMVLIERSIRDVLKKLESFIKNTLEFHPECHFSKILIHLFDDQDDHLIEAMVCTLDVTAGISFRNNAFPELVSMLNPVYTFLEFLKMISNSSDLLLDLLVSNETCFLLYLLRFLKYIRLNWSMFVSSCQEFNGGSYRRIYGGGQSSSSSLIFASSSSSSLIATGGTIQTQNTTLDDAMSVLIRLRLQISRLVSKSLYPYDISPVLRLLESCESLYEGNELS